MSIKNVLIIDDSKTSRAQLSKLLQNYDLQITTAESAEEAIDYLQQRQPDAIFLDHTMPGMDGLQALKIIKDNPGTSLIPVAMYTSKDDDGYADQVREQGAVDILFKPPTPATVSDVFGKLDAAYLSASANVAKMPAPAARTKAAAEAASLASIEDMVSSTVRVQLGSVVKNRLTPMLEERIEAVGQQLLDSTEKMAESLIDGRINDRIAAESNRLRVGIAAESEKLRAALAADSGRQREAMQKVLDEQLALLEKNVGAQLANLKKELRDGVRRLSEDSAKRIEQGLSSRMTAQLAKKTEHLRGASTWSVLALLVGAVAVALHFIEL